MKRRKIACGHRSDQATSSPIPHFHRAGVGECSKGFPVLGERHGSGQTGKSRPEFLPGSGVVDLDAVGKSDGSNGAVAGNRDVPGARKSPPLLAGCGIEASYPLRIRDDYAFTVSQPGYTHVVDQGPLPAWQSSEQLAFVQVPNTDGAIEAGNGQLGAIERKGNAGNRI